MNCDLILVLDMATQDEMNAVLDRVGDSVRWVKIGLQLFTRYGPALVESVAARGYKVFLDLKLHDIPNTVARAVESLAHLPISMLTLHTSGGAEMMRWAEKARAASKPDLLLLGVTVLTSMDDSELRNTGVAASPADQVIRLGRLASEAGLRGLVCSPHELASLRRELGDNITLVTPGIRPADAAKDDQKRVMTPAEAAAAGSNFIVVGRPILKAPDPAEAARKIVAELRA